MHPQAPNRKNDPKYISPLMWDVSSKGLGDACYVGEVITPAVWSGRVPWNFRRVEVWFGMHPMSCRDPRVCGAVLCLGRASRMMTGSFAHAGRRTYACFYQLDILFVAVLVVRALLFAVDIRDPNVWVGSKACTFNTEAESKTVRTEGQGRNIGAQETT